MKQLILVLGLATAYATASSQVLIRYGQNTITKDEFLRAYNKNKPAGAVKEQSLRDYVDLYTNFKLKVKAAEALRLDTIQQISYDVSSFRSQIVDNYLSDEQGVARMEREIFARSLTDKHVIHFFVPLTSESSAKDSSAAKQAAEAIYQKLQTGASPYEAMIAEVSSTYFPARNSDLGFVTVFNVPYVYENIIYGLKPGEQSRPYLGPNGWHIFKDVEDRPSAGKWKIAQILFSFPPDASEELKSTIRKRADSVYALINNGMSFGQAVKQFSDDRITNLSDGELPEFGTGKYAIAFEKPVFALQHDGDISKPFETKFGYHIVKRISYTPTVTDSLDESNKFDLHQKLMQDPRINIEKEKFAKSLVSITKFKRNLAVSNDELFRNADSLFRLPSAERVRTLPVSRKVIANFPDQKVMGADWLQFLRDYTAQEQVKPETKTQLLDRFIKTTTLDYYKKNLERFNPDFRFQMQEFREGNMLFEIMERNVWNKATGDTLGLKRMYEAKKSSYKWQESANVLIVNASSEPVARKAMEDLKSGKPWQMIVDENGGKVQIDSGRYELSQIAVAGPGAKQPNTYSTITTINDGTAAFVKYIYVYPANQQRSYEEAKGLVINDYQAELEKQWIASLRKKYPVQVNETVFKSLLP